VTDTSQASRAVAVGDEHACVVLADGTVSCWGNRNNHKLGTGLSGAWTAVPEAVTTVVEGQGVVPLSSVVEVGASLNHSCARRSEGSVSCWGLISSGDAGAIWQSERAKDMWIQDVIDIDVGLNHACAVVGSGDVYCWGDNTKGQLGYDQLPEPYSTGPTKVPAVSKVVSVAAGHEHTCALMAGQVTCWGNNQRGQVGESTGAAEVLTPTLVVDEESSGASAIQAISAGAFHTCALRMDGRLWCWGATDYKALGDITAGVSQLPVVLEPTVIQDVTQLTSGWGFNCTRDHHGQLFCWGANYTGQSGIGSSEDNVWPPGQLSFAGSPVAALSAGGSSACAVGHGGLLGCWGVNNFGQLGYETSVDESDTMVFSAAPGLVVGVSAAPGATQVFASGDDTCVIRSDGRLRCWGKHAALVQEQLAGKHPVFMTLGLTPGYQCANVPALLSDPGGQSTVDCVGVGSIMILALDEPEAPTSPMQVETLVSSPTRVCALFGGDPYCIEPSVGEASWEPHGIGGSFKVMGLGTDHLCGLRANGKIRCGGQNDKGQLGAEPGEDVVDEDGTTVLAKAISVRGDRSCAVLLDGTVYCWGDVPGVIHEKMSQPIIGPEGQPHARPPVVGVALRDQGYCVHFSDGLVWCAEADESDLAYPGKFDSTTVGGDVTAMVAGRAHTCALLVDGSVRCWGDNAEGQSGCSEPVCLGPTRIPLVD